MKSEKDDAGRKMKSAKESHNITESISKRLRAGYKSILTKRATKHGKEGNEACGRTENM
jgi:hypothetical protein